MYQATQPVVVTAISEMGRGRGEYAFLPTNGTYVRSFDGGRLFVWRRSNRKHLHLPYYATQVEEQFNGIIKDKLLVERIVAYWNECFDKRKTNCATFSSFLLTGEFHDFVSGEITVPGTMQILMPDMKVDVGDMICVMYLDQKKAGSRKNRWRSAYREVRKSRRKGRGFKNRLDMSERVHSADAIQDMTRWDMVQDYHFMVCIDYIDGEPVWLSQCGWHSPGDDKVPFVVTKGWFDPYPHLIHGMVFIRRRK